MTYIETFNTAIACMLKNIVDLTGGVNGGLICFSNIIPKLYRLMHGTDFNFLTVVILSSGLTHNNCNNKK